MLLCLFGDAHSRFTVSVGAVLPKGYAPFRTASYDGRVVAFTPDRKAFVDPEHPFLRKIDGVAVERWLEAAGRIVPQASAQLMVRGRMERLVFLGYLRQELELPQKEKVQLELESLDKKSAKKVALLLEGKPGDRSDRAWKQTGHLGEYGYLRISQMATDPKFLEGLDASMAELKDTKGLVIDVRDNPGGTQDALKTLLPYFLRLEEPLQIVNVAAYRLPLQLPKPNPSGFLGLHGRSLHPVTSKVWKPEEADLIRKFLETFKPSWLLPAGKFSDWHVMAIDPRSNPKAYRYDRHVCVLSNAGSFSASDNFLGAFKGRPNVTIVGTPSGGGSGRMQDYKLPNSALRFTLCQMASYSRTGQLYDGNGVQPDIFVEERPEDHIGKGDAVLDAALKVLEEKKKG